MGIGRKEREETLEEKHKRLFPDDELPSWLYEHYEAMNPDNWEDPEHHRKFGWLLFCVIAAGLLIIGTIYMWVK